MTRVNGGRHFSSRVFLIVFSCVLVGFRCVFEVSFNLEVLIVNVFGWCESLKLRSDTELSFLSERKNNKEHRTLLRQMQVFVLSQFSSRTQTFS